MLSVYIAKNFVSWDPNERYRMHEKFCVNE